MKSDRLLEATVKALNGKSSIKGKYNSNELDAIKKGLNYLSVDLDDNDIEKYSDEITINNGRDGKEYAWIYWNDNHEVAVNVDTLEIIDNKDEIEKLFL